MSGVDEQPRSVGTSSAAAGRRRRGNNAVSSFVILAGLHVGFLLLLLLCGASLQVRAQTAASTTTLTILPTTGQPRTATPQRLLLAPTSPTLYLVLASWCGVTTDVLLGSSIATDMAAALVPCLAMPVSLDGDTMGPAPEDAARLYDLDLCHNGLLRMVIPLTLPLSPGLDAGSSGLVGSILLCFLAFLLNALPLAAFSARWRLDRHGPRGEGGRSSPHRDALFPTLMLRVWWWLSPGMFGRSAGMWRDMLLFWASRWPSKLPLLGLANSSSTGPDLVAQPSQVPPPAGVDLLWAAVAVLLALMPLIATVYFHCGMRNRHTYYQLRRPNGDADGDEHFASRRGRRTDVEKSSIAAMFRIPGTWEYRRLMSASAPLAGARAWLSFLHFGACVGDADPLAMAPLITMPVLHTLRWVAIAITVAVVASPPVSGGERALTGRLPPSTAPPFGSTAPPFSSLDGGGVVCVVVAAALHAVVALITIVAQPFTITALNLSCGFTSATLALYLFLRVFRDGSLINPEVVLFATAALTLFSCALRLAAWFLAMWDDAKRGGSEAPGPVAEVLPADLTSLADADGLRGFVIQGLEDDGDGDDGDRDGDGGGGVSDVAAWAPHRTTPGVFAIKRPLDDDDDGGGGKAAAVPSGEDGAATPRFGGGTYSIDDLRHLYGFYTIDDPHCVREKRANHGAGDGATKDDVNTTTRPPKGGRLASSSPQPPEHAADGREAGSTTMRSAHPWQDAQTTGHFDHIFSPLDTSNSALVEGETPCRGMDAPLLLMRPAYFPEDRHPRWSNPLLRERLEAQLECGGTHANTRFLVRY